MTDGSGNTVYFSESVIVFTSNIGALPNGQDTDPRQQEARIRRAIEQHFTEELSRPELLNRIGDNIIIFDPITADVGKRLVRKYIDSVIDVAAQRLGVRLTIDPQVVDMIESFAFTRLQFGGRGIGTAVESTLVNPLTRALMTLPRPGTYCVCELTENRGKWELRVEG